MLLEDDFRSEWKAIEDAVLLRGEVCCISLDDWHRSKVSTALPDVPPVPARHRSADRVRFHDSIHVLTGDAHVLSMDSFHVPVQHLSAWLRECDLDCSSVEEPPSDVMSPALHARDSLGSDSTCSTSTSPFDFVVLNVPVETTLDDEVDISPQACHDCHLVDAPSWHSSQQTPHALRHQWIPNPDTLPAWWADLRRLHDVAAVTENVDEGPVLYLLTWFIHGQLHPQCRDQQRLKALMETVFLNHLWVGYKASFRLMGRQCSFCAANGSNKALLDLFCQIAEKVFPVLGRTSGCTLTEPKRRRKSLAWAALSGRNYKTHSKSLFRTKH